MRWLFSAHKATQCFLNSQRYHFHGRPPSQVFQALSSFGWSKPNQVCSYSVHYYSTSHLFPNGNKIEIDVNKVDLEIISRDIVKPSCPTPHHLRTFNLSIIDQVMFDIYIPKIVFFPNTDQASVIDVVTKRSKHLKETLSEILTKFYPFAGKVKDNLHIECTDEGIYYTEARVNQTLHEFLGHPHDERVRRLMPKNPCTGEPSMGNHVIGIQVNIFKCGGIALSMSASHKIIDGHSFYMFMKAWAAAARDALETVSPSFVASEIFPNNPCVNYTMPSKLLATEMLTTKRFVFDSTALALLKAQVVAGASSTHPPSRTEATSAIIWKAAAQAASRVRPFGPKSPHILFSPVNLRKRASPPFPKESIGNLFTAAVAICFPDGNLHLPTLMSDLKKSIAKINSDHINSMKGEAGRATFHAMGRILDDLTNMIAEGDYMFATSALNSGMYELDFGWGKPIWFYAMNPGMARFVVLNDTLKGGGVEAVVTLSPDEMEIFEHDSELLSYATVNPSPLRFVH